MFITVIQISAAEAIFARFQKQRSQLLFLEGVRHRLEEASLAELVASWSDKSRGDRIVLSLQPSLFSIRELDLPIDDRKKAREILPLELKGETAMDSDEMIFEALPLSPGSYAAAWSRQSRLLPTVTLLAEAGLDPEVVTSPMFTWRRLLSGNDSTTAALTDGEAVAVFSGGTPVHLRGLPASGAKRISTTLAALSLAKGIETEQIFAIGACDSDTLEVDAAPLPITPGLAACFPSDAAAARDLASTYAAAMDLLSGDPVNFRRGPLTYERKRLELRRKLRLTAILAAVVVLLLFGEAGLRYYLLQKDIASVEVSIRKIYSEAFPKRGKPVDEVAELKAEIRRLGSSSSQIVLASLKKLAEAKGDEINDLYEVDIEGNLLTGKGTARSIQAVNDFKTKCTPLFGSFEVSEIKSRPDGSTGFSFRSAGKEAGK